MNDLESFIAEVKEKLKNEGKLPKLAKISINDTVYIVRGFNRKEWLEFANEAINKGVQLESPEFEELTVSRMLVYPNNISFDSLEAGISTTLFDLIMQLSGFTGNSVSEPEFI